MNPCVLTNVFACGQLSFSTHKRLRSPCLRNDVTYSGLSLHIGVNTDMLTDKPNADNPSETFFPGDSGLYRTD